MRNQYKVLAEKYIHVLSEIDTQGDEHGFADEVQPPINNMDEIVKRVAQDVAAWQAKHGVKDPRQVMPDVYYSTIINDIEDQGIKDLWRKMDDRQKIDFMNKVSEYLSSTQVTEIASNMAPQDNPQHLDRAKIAMYTIVKHVSQEDGMFPVPNGEIVPANVILNKIAYATNKEALRAVFDEYGFEYYIG